MNFRNDREREKLIPIAAPLKNYVLIYSSMGRAAATTGIKLYTSSVWDRIQTDLSQETKKVSRKMILSEVQRRWVCLPDSTRELWESRAKK